MGKKKANGEGSIYQRPNGQWAAQITIGRNPETGKLKRMSLSGRTKTEVREKVNKALVDIQEGTFVQPTKLTVGEWLDTWLKEYTRAHVRDTTWDNYQMVTRAYVKPAIGYLQLRQLTPDHLQRLYNNLLATKRKDGNGTLSHRTVRLVYTTIHAALKQAVTNQLVVRNVADATKPPRLQRQEMRVLLPEEESCFLETIEQDRLKMAFLLALGTGLRRGELLALRWQDVDMKEGMLHVRRTLVRVTTDNTPAKTAIVYQEPKTKQSRRSVPIPEVLLPELKTHKARQAQERLFLGGEYQENGLVFCTPDGRPLDPSSFTRLFSKLAQNAGLSGATLHSIRHTYATRLLEANEHPKVVQELLGHSNITMTLDTYSHVMPELKRAAAAKLNSILSKRKVPSTVEGN